MVSISGQPQAGATLAAVASETTTPYVTLDNHHTLILAILVLFLGRWVNRRIHWLRDYGIPEPVTGGLIASRRSRCWSW